MNTWWILAIAIIAEALKVSEGFTRLIPSLVVVIGYSIAFYGLALTLKVIPVGVAYAIWSGMGIVLVALIGWFVFDQKLDPAAIIGMVLIITGVVVMNVFSASSGH